MIKRTTTAIVLTMMTTLLFAIPARKKPFTLTQVDGTTMTVRLVGDETMHYYTTLDGTPLVKDADGMYRPATFFETQNIKAKHAQRIKKRNEARSQRTAARRAKGTYTGEKRGLVILVNFKDLNMKSTSTPDVFDDLFNKEGYNKNNHIGSVRDYFLAQSYGQLTIDFDIVGPYTLSENMAYYGEDEVDEDGDPIEGMDKHPAEMIIETLKKANGDVNYKDYDWDGDGEVEQVYVLYAGYSQAHGAKTTTIWPHEWTLEEALQYGDGTGPLILDGVILNTYACSSELINVTGSTISTIGTAVHEFSHCLGLPDLYDTDSQINFGMNSWSVMDSGSYNGKGEWGEVPAGYTSYERMFAGWLTPVELNSPCIINDMKAINSTPEAYIIYNDNNKNEYYMLENRQLQGFDSYLYGHGMLVLHIDYNKKVWEANGVNNVASHQRCTIIPADNQFMTGSYFGEKYATDSDLAGDPYPGTSNNKALTDTSKPAATLYNANSDGRKFMGKPIENITENNQLISFYFMGGIMLDTPELAAESDITSTSFTASWKAVSDATGYDIELKYYSGDVLLENMLVMNENFSKLASVTKDESTDLGSTLDSYMNNAGWSGTKVFASPNRLKMGSSKQSGTLVSPIINAPQSGNVTISLSETEYTLNQGIDVVVSIVSENGTTIASQTIQSGNTTHVINFNGVESSYKVMFAPSKRIYFTGISIFDGELTAEQIDENGNIATTTTVKCSTTQTLFTFTDLDPDIIYEYRVRAYTDNIYGPWTEWTPVTLNHEGSTADVNHDGMVDTQDVLAVYEYMKTHSATDKPDEHDVNGDGVVDTQDVLTIYNMMKG